MVKERICGFLLLQRAVMTPNMYVPNMHLLENLRKIDEWFLGKFYGIFFQILKKIPKVCYLEVNPCCIFLASKYTLSAIDLILIADI